MRGCDSGGAAYVGNDLLTLDLDMSETSLTISANAARQLNKVLAEEAGAALRITVEGGGCSGFQYKFDVDRAQSDDDYVAERDGAKVVVDPTSLELLNGAELDFIDDLMGRAFKVINPNAKASCGCGVSFSI
jgi:iron-sulfur cluster assembly accessory protein